jgi:hypothetical protein
MKKKPCKLPCPKCGSDDINREFLRKGKDRIIYSIDDEKERKNEFITRERYTIYVKKDCITHHCRCCQYEWESGVLSK